MAHLTPSLIALIAATFFVGGVVKGVTGLGLPTMAMGVLGAALSPLTAAGLILAPSFITNVWQVLAGRRFGELVRRLWPLLAASFLGTLGGTALLAHGAPKLTTAALGATLAAYAAYALFAGPQHAPRAWERWASPVVGLSTGVVVGATGVSMIPAVPYIQSLGLERDDLVQALGLFFTVSTIALASGLLWRHAASPASLLASGLAVIPSLAGMAAGQALRSRISPPVFRKVFLGLLLVLGAEMAVRALA